MSAMTDLGSRRQEVLARASRTLGEFLASDARARDLLASQVYLPPDYGPIAAEAVARGGFGELRLEKRRRLAEIATRDLMGEIDLPEVGLRLARLADACLQVTLDELDGLEGFAVIGMGKLGARELNYYSDIDLMFVSEGDVANGTRVAERLRSTLGEPSPEGRAYVIDLNLRPEGRSGALVRSVDGYLEYYKRWAKEWEYQALLKARCCAGDREIGERLLTGIEQLVFAEEVSEERVQEVRRMKERVEGHAQRSARRARLDERNNVKLGPGGIRDIEFSIQLLQLVHGGSDPSVRQASTLGALAALADGGFVAEEDAAGLTVAYRWLRNVEHRLQLWQERQTHSLPDDEADMARLARVLGFKDAPSASAATRFERAHAAVLGDVRARFEKLFYRPMIEALSEGAGSRLSPEALQERLRVLGFRHVEKAARTLEGLVAGTSRRAKLFRVLTPALLRFLAATPQPDTGLFSFLRLGEALQSRLDGLGSMRDNPPGLELLAKVLGSGRLLGDVLVHVPDEVAAIADPRRTAEVKSRERLVREAASTLEWRGPERLLEGLRRFKRREMLRTAVADIAGEIDAAGAGAALTDLAEACLEVALGDPEDFAIIGLGKLGGSELGYASDLDVLFLFEGDQADGERTAEELMRAIGEVTPEGQAFRIDADLRPEGRSGALARSVDSAIEYYGRWAEHWEHQALIKARHVAGNPEIGERFIADTRAFAFPEELGAAAVRQIRHLKARMERERIKRGTDPRRHLKLGPGGMSDIEFAAQVLQQRYGYSHEPLRVSGTLRAIEGARTAELLDPDAALSLMDAYTFLLRMRNRLFFLQGRPVDTLPVKPEELEALGIGMGFYDQPRQELEDAYRRVTRRARRVCEPIIYEDPDPHIGSGS